MSYCNDVSALVRRVSYTVEMTAGVASLLLLAAVCFPSTRMTWYTYELISQRSPSNMMREWSVHCRETSNHYYRSKTAFELSMFSSSYSAKRLEVVLSVRQCMTSCCWSVFDSFFNSFVHDVSILLKNFFRFVTFAFLDLSKNFYSELNESSSG